MTESPCITSLFSGALPEHGRLGLGPAQPGQSRGCGSSFIHSKQRGAHTWVPGALQRRASADTIIRQGYRLRQQEPPIDCWKTNVWHDNPERATKGDAWDGTIRGENAAA